MAAEGIPEMVDKIVARHAFAQIASDFALDGGRHEFYSKVFRFFFQLCADQLSDGHADSDEPDEASTPAFRPAKQCYGRLGATAALLMMLLDPHS